MLDGDGAERGEDRRLLQHAQREVRGHADAFPLAGAQGAGLVPDRVGHAEPAEVVDDRGASQRGRVLVGQLQRCGGTSAQSGDGAGVAERISRMFISTTGGGVTPTPNAPIPPA